MIRRGHEEQVDRLGNLQPVSRDPDHPQVRDPARIGGLPKVVERAGAGIEREDDPARVDGTGQPQGEVPVSGAEVSDGHPGADSQRLDHHVRVPQPIAARAARVQQAAQRAWKAIEHPLMLTPSGRACIGISLAASRAEPRRRPGG